MGFPPAGVLRTVQETSSLLSKNPAASPTRRRTLVVVSKTRSRYSLLVLALCAWMLSSSCALGPRSWKHRDDVVGTVELYWGEGMSSRDFELVFFRNGWLELVDSATIDPLYYYRRPCYQLRESDFRQVMAAFEALGQSLPRVSLSKVSGSVLVGDFGSRPVDIRIHPLSTAEALASHPDLTRLLELALQLGIEHFPKLFGKRLRTHPLAELLTPAQLDAPPRHGRQRCTRSTAAATALRNLGGDQGSAEGVGDSTGGTRSKTDGAARP